jgi:hypothetical protein
MSRNEVVWPNFLYNPEIWLQGLREITETSIIVKSVAAEVRSRKCSQPRQLAGWSFYKVITVMVAHATTGWFARNWQRYWQKFSSTYSLTDRDTECTGTKVRLSVHYDWVNLTLCYNIWRENEHPVKLFHWLKFHNWSCFQYLTTDHVIEAEVTLQLTVSQSVSQVSSPLWDLWPDITFCRKLFSESCCLVSVGRPLWREVGPFICNSQSIVIF